MYADSFLYPVILNMKGYIVSQVSPVVTGYTTKHECNKNLNLTQNSSLHSTTFFYIHNKVEMWVMFVTYAYSNELSDACFVTTIANTCFFGL